jgi:hypothetical protein
MWNERHSKSFTCICICFYSRETKRIITDTKTLAIQIISIRISTLSQLELRGCSMIMALTYRDGKLPQQSPIKQMQITKIIKADN